MIRLRTRHALRQDEGVAMLFVIAIGFVVTLLMVAMLSSVLQGQATTRQHRNVTSAQAAAEAGIDDMVYQLGQYHAAGVTNWAYLPTQWTSQSQSYATPLGSNNATAKVWLTAGTGAQASDLIIWSKGKYGANTRTIRVVVTRGSPPAFDFSMFASKGIDIHQHGSWLSPQVWTTSVHSNGYINIDYPSEFTVNTMEAVGALTFQKGGGRTPAGSVTTAGYNWPDPLNGMCYPGGYGHPGGVPQASGGCSLNYSGNAVISGTIKAGSVTMGSRGQVLKAPSGFTLDTGQTIDGGGFSNGSITAGTASINGTTYTTSTAPSCAVCNQANPQAGQIAGSLTVKGSGWSPPVVPFPSIDFSQQYRSRAATAGTVPNNPSCTCGYFSGTSGASNFINWAAGTTSNYYCVDTTNNNQLVSWSTNPCSTKYPDVILLNGNFDIGGGSLSFNYGSIQKLVEAKTGMIGPAPIIIVAGSLVDETGGISINSGLVVVGSDNATNFVVPGSSTTPVTINTAAMLAGNAQNPGILAAGGTINSSDYDTDSPWTSTSSYEPMKATPVYVRGLVYTASYNATTGTSTPQNQHWHNFDPKNLMKIYGAQVGADLHDCNNFSFSYDPIVKNAFGFGTGSVKVIDYQELGS